MKAQFFIVLVVISVFIAVESKSGPPTPSRKKKPPPSPPAQQDDQSPPPPSQQDMEAEKSPKKGVNATCTTNDECAMDLCEDNKCANPCKPKADGAGDGEPCDEPADCKSRVCLKDVCAPPPPCPPGSDKGLDLGSVIFWPGK